MGLRVVERYVLDDLLGAGATGMVFRARDLRLNRVVALKLLSEKLRKEDAAWGMMLQEAQAGASLNHPHICQTYDIGEEDGQPYIAMEYIDGPSLRKVLEGAPLSARHVVRCGGQISEALGYAHEHGVVHGDIKPSNICVALSGGVKLLDFGLAHLARRYDVACLSDGEEGKFRKDGWVRGTLPYTSPELVRGGSPTFQSDLWSVGVVLYEMATGALPFRGDSPAELGMEIMLGEPLRVPAPVPTGVAAVIERCLARDLGQRYRSARELLRELQSVGE